MNIQKRVYFFIPMRTPIGRQQLMLLNKYRRVFEKKGIQKHVYESELLGITPTAIYLVGQSNIIATAKTVNESVIQKLLSINIVVNPQL